MKLNGYLTIDTETTGLDTKTSQVLQVAAVWDDLKTPIRQLRGLNMVVDYGRIYGEPFALAMNQALLYRLAGKDRTGVLNQMDAITQWGTFITDLRAEHDGARLFIAGKNAAGFDVPMLKNNGFDVSGFHHRVIDPGSLYFTDFGYPPSQNEINKLTGRDAVSHDALEDCYDVIVAIRKKLGVPIE